MKLAQTIKLQAGGPGSGRHKGKTAQDYRKEQDKKSTALEEKPVNSKTHSKLSKGHTYIGNHSGMSLYKAKVGGYTLGVTSDGKYKQVNLQDFK